MSIQKEQKIDMYLEKLSIYSNYVSCLTRVILELIENGYSNLKPTDIAYLANLLNTYSNMLHSKITRMKTTWEFEK